MRGSAGVTGDAAAYRYLAESIRMHPDRSDAAAMMGTAGWVASGLQPCRRSSPHRGFRI
jgi:ubiquinone/menaquinone biosynthesis C-methylase UbiE